MSKTLANQALNKVSIVGKLLDIKFREGTMSDGRAYESATMTIRTTQTYGGREETSEIPVSLFASKYTRENKLNPGYEQIQNMRDMKTAQNVGIDAADTVFVKNGNLRENNFVSKSGQLISSWQINTLFCSTGNLDQVASFTMDIFILDMHPEEDREGDLTGRLIIKGAVVQYNESIDVLEFVVEDPNSVDYIQRYWNINDTVNIKGRIRMTVEEEKVSGQTSSWGEEIPEMTTRTVRELIITKGDDQGKDEELAYDPAEIKKGFNARKAKIEQMQIDPKSRKRSTSTQSGTSKYSWE